MGEIRPGRLQSEWSGAMVGRKFEYVPSVVDQTGRRARRRGSVVDRRGGIASAGPNLDSAINTTCTYPQLVSALDAQDPQVRMAFDQSPILQRGLREFIADAPAKRAKTAQDVANAPMFQPYLGTIEQAFNTCNNF